ncbi:RNA 2',3'-cyclic phosphodiesterase [Aurantiacibacter gilvus]|uniref:RNA 2',3'-cyclic phosphodiesterase n=1 Tax=Aurantiacibacter gilvus TaxID=3139141 RepID=A0ABU9IG04_9SPHN
MTRRLFLAVTPPPAVSDALLDLQEGIPGARWVDSDHFHLTLRFVGEVDRHMAADLETALDGLAFTPFTLQLSGVGHFEGPKRAKAIWAGVMPSGDIDLLHYRTEMACRRAGLPPETRRFVPHVTLARLNAGSGFIGDWLRLHGAFTAVPWPVDSFALFESNLTPNGAIYTELRRFSATGG